MLRAAYLTGMALLLGLVSFVIGSATGPLLTLAWAAGAGIVSTLGVRFLLPAGNAPHDLAAMLVAGSGLALGGALKWMVGSPAAGWQDPIALLVAEGGAWAADVLLSRDAATPCFICHQPLEEGAHFTCPRCRETICTRPSCWVARHFRCRSCDERDVVLFPIAEETWWRTRLGARVTTGACASCYKEADETDLRACGRCQWPSCKRCWDYHNGQCTHCQWVLPDLPAALRPFLASRSEGAAAAVNAGRRPR
jgi:hypothetical protein